MKFHIPLQSKLLEKAHVVTSSLLSELFLRQSYRKSDFVHSPELAASCITTSLEDNSGITRCCLLFPKRTPGTKGSRGGQPPPPPATELPVSAAEQTVGPANFTLQLLGKVFQLLICITLSCCPRNISDITNSGFRKNNYILQKLCTSCYTFPLPPYILKGLKPNKCK